MEVIEELIKLAKEMDAATKRGEDLGLTDDEVAFYDALAVNESAVKAMGEFQSFHHRDFLVSIILKFFRLILAGMPEHAKSSVKS